MKQAIRDENPVLVFEHKLLYGGKRKEAGQLSATARYRRRITPFPSATRPSDGRARISPSLPTC